MPDIERRLKALEVAHDALQIVTLTALKQSLANGSISPSFLENLKLANDQPNPSLNVVVQEVDRMRRFLEGDPNAPLRPTFTVIDGGRVAE